MQKKSDLKGSDEEPMFKDEKNKVELDRNEAKPDKDFKYGENTEKPD